MIVARTLLYGLIAAASPLAFAATVVVLRSRLARLNGTIFAAAFVLAGLGVVLAALAIGSAAAKGPGGSDVFSAAAELALGALLLLAGIRVHHGIPSARAETPGRTQAVLDRLARITPKAAFPTGALLGIGGPKRLTVGIVAAATISGADLDTAEQVPLAILYVAVATILVWAPVSMYLVAGERVGGWLAEAEQWLLENQRLFAAVSLLVFGAILAVDGLVRLA